MSAQILIVDSVATQRILMRVKMKAAQFRVAASASISDASSAIKRVRPDLVLISPQALGDSFADDVKRLRAAAGRDGIVVVAYGVSDTAQARFAALDGGADDVFPHPVDDALLLARIRSLLRLKSVTQELQMRDSTDRAFGFDDVLRPFDRLSTVVFASKDDPQIPASFLEACQGARLRLRPISAKKLLSLSQNGPHPDLVIVDARAGTQQTIDPRQLLADLRARKATRLSATMVLLDQNQKEDAAILFDLGADDVVIDQYASAELELRMTLLTERKRHHDRLRQRIRAGLDAAMTDPLTGLFNRRYIMPHLTRLAEDALTSGRHFAVMMLDIDHFKAINDRYGHDAGDSVLRDVAARLRENLRAIDLVGRLGGEEFIVAMPRTSQRQARLAADRLRQLVGDTPFQIGEDQFVSISASVGVALSDAQTVAQPRLGALCKSADTALYCAKNAGRNRIAMAPSAA
ncbi:diguanylate cyclase [Yoonia litorea]|uniref:diguanylate cyclase n=1 Tax=Yoonia litorea TaxID=1123755 RepID=A0A1I6LG92_9RHOB|nr:diguanylate cyclase [Yoonia litorea]SFS02463.1 response regulator receiver modulated diguanylate cyclase [Yoonia litorea]